MFQNLDFFLILGSCCNKYIPPESGAAKHCFGINMLAYQQNIWNTYSHHAKWNKDHYHPIWSKVT
jgi:hypothetical protein